MKNFIVGVCSALALFILACCSMSEDPGSQPFETMIRKVLAGEAHLNDHFGCSVAISGDYAIVGASGENHGVGDLLEDAGAAYVFHRTGVDTWDDGVKLVVPEAQWRDYFGRSVTISGDYAIVGAPGEDGGAGDPRFDAGAAYVFHRTGNNTWDSGVKLVAPDAPEGAHFGFSVAINGDYAIVGACDKYGGTDSSIQLAGAAYIFRRTGDNTWDSGVELESPNAQSGGSFGYSVAISGDTAVVGTYSEDGGAGGSYSYAGAAYIFRRTGDNAWDDGVQLVAPDVQAGDKFGTSVAIDGDYIIVGAHGEDGGAGDPLVDTGAAYIFRRSAADTWDSVVKIVAPNAQTYYSVGCSVSISGQYAIVGAEPLYSNAAYIFQRTGDNTWNGGMKIAAPNARKDDKFGYSVGISGGYAIVGALGEAGGTGDLIDNAGAAYIFR